MSLRDWRWLCAWAWAIPSERPPKRKEISEDPRYCELREHLITFLNDRSHIHPCLEPEFKLSPKWPPNSPAKASNSKASPPSAN